MPVPRLAGAWFVVVAAITLTACTHVPLSTMLRMRRFDPAAVDPAVLRAAVRVPDRLAPMRDGVKLIVRYAEDRDRVRESEYVLEESTSGADIAAVASRAVAGTRIHLFRIPAADVPRLRAFQAEAAAARRKGTVHGSLTISADTCRFGELPGGPLSVTTYVKLDATDDFVTLFEDVDLRKVVARDAALGEVIPVCRSE